MSGIRDEIKKWFLDAKKESPISEKEDSQSNDLPTKTNISTYIFVDLDNTSWNEVGSNVVLDEHTEITFYADYQHKPMLTGENMNKRTKHIKANVKTVSSKIGHNATDFKILCDVATALVNPGTEFVYIVSKDSDYDEAIEHLRDMYKGKVQAIEKFSSIEECISDMRLMRSETKEEIRKEIVERFSRPYREEALYKLLDLLEA